MRGLLVITSLLLLAAAGAPAAPGGAWDFETNAAGWIEPGQGCCIAADPDDPRNHAYCIEAARPHHTQLFLAGSEDAPDFTAALRFRVLSWEGAPPVVYVYGRVGEGGFRALSASASQATAFAYYGQAQPSKTLGRIPLASGLQGRGWQCVKLVCRGDQVYAKAWNGGSPEPRWQAIGSAPGLARGRFAVGVWTSPRTPSKARVLFDDISFHPLSQAHIAALEQQTAPRPPLDPGLVGRTAASAGMKGSSFETDDLMGVFTPGTLLAFDRASGEIAHLVQDTTGRDLIASNARRPLFSLTLTQPGKAEGGQVASSEFGEVSVARGKTGEIELRFGKHPLVPLSVRVTASPMGAGGRIDGLVHLRLSVSNPSEWIVKGVCFPIIAAPAALGGDASDDALLLPWADGALLPAPGTRDGSREALYPEQAFTQFAALYDPTAGIYLAAQDPGGHCKRWEMRTVAGRSVEMSLTHLLPETLRRELEVPYDLVLGTFRGDWRDAADLYKRWAKAQPWCRRTLAERVDIPQLLKEGSGVIIAGIQNEAGRTALIGRDLEKLPELVAAYRNRTGLAHVIFVPYGWENRGTWAGINYFPAVPSDEAWRKANAALRAQGDRTAFLTSGFWWVVKRQKTGNGPAFDDTADFGRRDGMVVRQADGKPWTADSYDQVGALGDWRGLSAKLCHGSPEARRTMRGIFLNVARLGTPLVSFDQEIGGGQQMPCYSPAHGHPPGYGAWMWADFRDLCAEILRDGKPIQPELGLFMENCSELAIPYMATYWSRQFGEVDHGAAHARGIGLFSYLYHEYVTAIGAACVQGQGLLGTRPDASLRCAVLANNLARGLIPGPFLHEVPLETTDAWLSPVSRAYFSYCKPYRHFPEYLLLGATRRPPAVECAQVESWFYRADPNGEAIRPGGPKVRKVPIPLPAVRAGSFQAADGSIGTVVANTAAEPQRATLRMVAALRSAVLYSPERVEEQRWADLAAGASVPISLEAFGTRLLVTQEP